MLTHTHSCEAADTSSVSDVVDATDSSNPGSSSDGVEIFGGSRLTSVVERACASQAGAHAISRIEWDQEEEASMKTPPGLDTHPRSVAAVPGSQAAEVAGSILSASLQLRGSSLSGLKRGLGDGDGSNEPLPDARVAKRPVAVLAATPAV